MNTNDAATAGLFKRALEIQDRRAFGEAQQLYETILELDPDHPGANINLGFVHLAQGNRSKASVQFADTARRAPQILDQFDKVIDLLTMLIPTFSKSRQQAADAHPKILTIDSLLWPARMEIFSAPFFCAVLENTVVRDVGVECLLVTLRAGLLEAVVSGAPSDPSILNFASALGQQCFINEYVFATTPEEWELVTSLQEMLDDALVKGSAIDPLLPLVLAMYVPLHILPRTQAMLQRDWPAPVAAVMMQQIREIQQEEDLRAAMPRLTEIGDRVSLLVRHHYESNPYPRWVRLPAPAEPMTINQYLSLKFSAAAFCPLSESQTFDMLVAGCGTGQDALGWAQTLRNVRILAIDLSLASLAHAKRKTPPNLTGIIDFAQGDILSLGLVGRSFDIINCTGVLHHMADLMAGWRELVKLLRPGGLMLVGLYSELARNSTGIVAGSVWAAERGFQSSADDIRRCRQDLLSAPQTYDFVYLSDFFTISTCRDLLFHKQEQRVGIPEIKAFLTEQDLKFVGFDFDPVAAREHSAAFAKAGWALDDLDHWHAYELANSKTFIGMYKFWIQKK